MSAAMDFSALRIAKPVTGRASKTASVHVGESNQRASWTLPPLAPIFEPSAFGGETDATRLTVSFRVPDNLLAELEALDLWLIPYATEHSERLFGRTMTQEQVVEHYSSPLKIHETYGPSLRAKYVASGRAGTRFWSPSNQPMPAPESWRDCSLKANVELSVWFRGRDFGITLTLNDARVEEQAVACPF